MLLKLSCCDLGDLDVFVIAAVVVVVVVFFSVFFPFASSFYLYVRWPQGRHSLELLTVSFRWCSRVILTGRVILQVV